MPLPETLSADFLIVGAGVAGLRAAVELAPAGTVFVAAKDQLRESSSEYAQGGIAAALSDDDEIGLHVRDTIAAGDGLCNEEAVRVLVEEGPRAIEELIAWGAEFDREGTRLLFAREGAHSRSRVLHAHGDSTGREIAKTLGRTASKAGSVSFHSFTSVTELLLDEQGGVCGAHAYSEVHDRHLRIHAKAVLLATGGLGQVFRVTTNPEVATGDGVALAWRAGAEISDIEFVQFHPTALHVPGAPSFLLSEALRGEGAYLRNLKGDRFMVGLHPMGELAPRDVVSRSIAGELARTGDPHVLLDLTHAPAGFIEQRFPRIYQTCLRYGVDLAKQPAPVLPAAHYAMGGVRTDLDGKTAIEGLFAAGETACTGVHGANRLASNSLLEGLVYGARAAKTMREFASRPQRASLPGGQALFPAIMPELMRDWMWRYCGIVRTGRGLNECLELFDAVNWHGSAHPRRAGYECRNIHDVGRLIAQCALARRESRGGHTREDFPAKDPAFEKHSVVKRGSAVGFEA